MRDEALVLLPARAGEQDLEDRRVRGAGETLELTEVGQCDAGLTPCGAREREPSRQSVIHGCSS